MAKQAFQRPAGTQDIYGKYQAYFQQIVKIARKISYEYNFEEIQTPILEAEELFIRSVGETTDIVQKEMYSLETKGGDRLALRPEGTASVVRSYIENDFYKKLQPVKFFYVGPFFRYERPQKGRYKQFHQFGLEILGIKSAALDAQLIQVLRSIFEALGLRVNFKVNSLGDDNCRPEYKKQLKKFLLTKKDILCEDCQRRIKENPLRVLDCKNETCQKVIEEAPQMVDYLCKACKKKFKELLELLDELDVPYEFDPFLVRGLDYYTHTVFEIFTEENRLALGGGGGYDKLVEILGGRETPACGGAVGIERVIDAMEQAKVKLNSAKKKIFLAQLGDSAKKRAFKLFEEFREAEIPVYETMGRNSLKSQMARADKLNVKYTLILGKQECVKNEIILREMKTGKQETIPLNKIVAEIKKRL